MNSFFKKNIFYIFLFLLAVSLAMPVTVYSESVPEDTTPQIPFSAVSIVSVKLATLPSKLTYTVGDSPDYSGATLKLTMSDRTERTVNVAAAWCTGFDSDTDGEKTITVTHPECGLSDSFTIRVNSKKVDRIIIDQPPSKLMYYAGDDVSIEGIRVRAIYEGGSTADVTEGVSLAEVDTSVPGESIPVTVYYYANSSRFQAVFYIKVLPVTVDYVKIATYPARNEFYDGENADYSGLTLTVGYRNGEDVIERTVSDLSLMSFEGYDPFKLGVQTITVSYEGMSDRFRVSVTLSEGHVHTPGEYTVLVQPTCISDGIEVSNCTVCGEEADRRSTGLAPHKWGDWLIISHATSSSDGMMERTCSVCGEKSTAVIPALNKILTNGDYSVEIGGTDLFAEGTSFDVSSIFSVVTAEELRPFSQAAGDGTVVDIIILAFRDSSGQIDIQKPMTYTFPMADSGGYDSFRIICGGETIPAAYDPAMKTLRFEMTGAGTVAVAGYTVVQEVESSEIVTDTLRPEESTESVTDATESPDTEAETGTLKVSEALSDNEPTGEPEVRDSGKMSTTVKIVIIIIILIIAGALVGALFYKRYIY